MINPRCCTTSEDSASIILIIISTITTTAVKIMVRSSPKLCVLWPRRRGARRPSSTTGETSPTPAIPTVNNETANAVDDLVIDDQSPQNNVPALPSKNHSTADFLPPARGDDASVRSSSRTTDRSERSVVLEEGRALEKGERRTGLERPEEADEPTRMERTRFLIANNGNEQKAEKALLKYMEFRRQHLGDAPPGGSRAQEDEETYLFPGPTSTSATGAGDLHSPVEQRDFSPLENGGVGSSLPPTLGRNLPPVLSMLLREDGAEAGGGTGELGFQGAVKKTAPTLLTSVLEEDQTSSRPEDSDDDDDFVSVVSCETDRDQIVRFGFEKRGPSVDPSSDEDHQTRSPSSPSDCAKLDVRTYTPSTCVSSSDPGGGASSSSEQRATSAPLGGKSCTRGPPPDRYLRDNTGCRVLIYFAAMYDPNVRKSSSEASSPKGGEKFSSTDYTHAVARWMDQQLDRNSDEKITLLVDTRAGWTWANPKPWHAVGFGIEVGG